MPRAVMPMSLRYPQLLCVLTRFSAKMPLATAVRIARVMLNDARRLRALHQFKTTAWISRRQSESVKPHGSTLSHKTAGIVVGGSLEAEVLSGR
jgi:lactate dehydrogenase-like 2-hydroxyacid dehydrogenase